MQIHKATAQDAQIFADLNQHVHALHLQQEPGFFRMPSDKEAENAFQELLSKENAHGFLVYVGSQAVGYLLAFTQHKDANAFVRARSRLYVDQISVEPAWQGQGIGRALMNVVLELAESAGVDEIEIDTWAFNEPAQSFFRSCGFKPRMHRLSITL